MIKDKTRIKGGIRINADVSVKVQYNRKRMKKIILGILLDIVVKMASI